MLLTNVCSLKRTKKKRHFTTTVTKPMYEKGLEKVSSSNSNTTITVYRDCSQVLAAEKKKKTFHSNNATSFYSFVD